MARPRKRRRAVEHAEQRLSDLLRGPPRSEPESGDRARQTRDAADRDFIPPGRHELDNDAREGACDSASTRGGWKFGWFIGAPRLSNGAHPRPDLDGDQTEISIAASLLVDVEMERHRGARKRDGTGSRPCTAHTPPTATCKTATETESSASDAFDDYLPTPR